MENKYRIHLAIIVGWSILILILSGFTNNWIWLVGCFGLIFHNTIMDIIIFQKKRELKRWNNAN